MAQSGQSQDETPSPELKVLVLGLCRTGTTSIKIALQRLGYQNVYDTQDVWERDDSLAWCKAIEAKYDRGEQIQFTEEPWVSTFRDYDCIADIPAALFATELAASFPNAKLVFTTRSLDSWMTSMRQTVVDPLNTSLYMQGPGLFDGQWRRFQRFCRSYERALWKSDFEKYGEECFVNHAKRVHGLGKAVEGSGTSTGADTSEPSTKGGDLPPLLEFRVADGWVPLCQFLDKPVPDEPYPRTHSAKEFQEGDRAELRSRYINFFKQLTVVVAPVLVAWIYWRRWR